MARITSYNVCYTKLLRTPYFYSTYEMECEAVPSDRKKIMILGGGPNRIGQGIEFDYCCVQAVLALKSSYNFV